MLPAETVQDADTVVLTAIVPVVEAACADALEIINRPSKQVNAVVVLAVTILVFLLKKKLFLLKTSPLIKPLSVISF